MDYLSVQDISNKWDISKRRIQVLCREGRIKGAKMIGNMWVVPADTERPVDARKKNPVVEIKKGHSIVRSDLKRLLKLLYKRSEEINVLEDDKKSYVLSLLAGELCFMFSSGNESKQAVYKQLYKDISGKELNYCVDNEMVFAVESYIEKYRDESEIDNVVSWAYQYSNKIIKSSDYSQTQFFTEEYMIQFLIKNIPQIINAKKILDPCSGGGNFLVECFEKICTFDNEECTESKVIEMSKRLYGYDIDASITRIAVVNIRIRALSILCKQGKKSSIQIWNKVLPNIFCPVEKDTIVGSLAKDNRLVRNILTDELQENNKALGDANVVITNPPFASVKGMSVEQKLFLKQCYPLSNCDTCVSFMETIETMMLPAGVCGIVSQNAWMYLKSFKNARESFLKSYQFYNIINLGAGAFIDLSGEKSNVSLLIFGKNLLRGEQTETVIQNLTMDTLSEKIKKIEDGTDTFSIKQDEINGVNGFVLSEHRMTDQESKSKELYSTVGVPMQGTSTGNAKELVGYFWNHFNDKEWIPVSNGGGYCRWEGLNNSVVKWGKDGEYIKAQKGSALRNVKHFENTELVFSDTGTAGLNVRILLGGQIFIASGPGIRMLKGNKYAHMAFLNSRYTANYVRTISPKLTIAAGYIGRVPIIESVFTSALLEKNAKLCVDIKREFLKKRPNNLEYISEKEEVENLNLEDMAWKLFKDDITNELLKLEIESQIDRYITGEYKLSETDMDILSSQIGECAFNIKNNHKIDIRKFDKYYAKLMDDACMLKRSRTSKSSLGCDGALEFASKDLNINPASIVEQVCQNKNEMEATLKKYKELVLHNTILDLLNYSVTSGVQIENEKIDTMLNSLQQIQGNNLDFKNWINKRFASIHSGIFKDAPFLIVEDGEIKKYDR